jgi:hypothetical protein
MAACVRVIHDSGILEHNSHSRQRYFSDEKRWWYDIMEMKGKERTFGRQE